MFLFVEPLASLLFIFFYFINLHFDPDRGVLSKRSLEQSTQNYRNIDWFLIFTFLSVELLLKSNPISMKSLIKFIVLVLPVCSINTVLINTSYHEVPTVQFFYSVRRAAQLYSTINVLYRH